MKIRLQSALSKAGIASRRKAGILVTQGKVKVNGMVVWEPAYPVDPGCDKIQAGGKELSVVSNVYILLNKPRGVTSTVSDPHAKKTVLDLLPKGKERLWPVGRLDKESAGLILLTNDGEMTYCLTHPRFLVKKEYLVTVIGKPGQVGIERFKAGVVLDGKKTAPCTVKLISARSDSTTFSVIIHEGRKRQVRRMFEVIGYQVMGLKRISLGPLKLGNLKEGSFRKLTQHEVQLLKKMVV